MSERKYATLNTSVAVLGFDGGSSLAHRQRFSEIVSARTDDEPHLPLRFWRSSIFFISSILDPPDKGVVNREQENVPQTESGASEFQLKRRTNSPTHG